ncbi:hypothetical protein WDM22_38560 [Bradyrhizobium septentrionale]|uniref:hypothetical protein n=1 Tax=Bradyrhizobium septentrionale TaxID=1404411 RepID=UPI0030D22C08
MFTADKDGTTEVHRYTDGEVADVFGRDAVALDEHGFFKTHGGTWIDMERAASERTSQIKNQLK